MLNGYNVEDQVEVSFNLRGREWTSPDGVVKYFNTLDAWRIEKAGAATTVAPTSAPMEQIPQEQPGWLENETSDDLPF